MMSVFFLSAVNIFANRNNASILNFIIFSDGKDNLVGTFEWSKYIRISRQNRRSSFRPNRFSFFYATKKVIATNILNFI